MPERLRTREMTSYFAAVGIDIDDTGCLRASSRPPEPVLSDDAVLNALTQIGALRLQCDRAFVSLIGQQWQYIIAESAPELPYRRSHIKPTDRMCLGFTAIASEMAICLNTLRCFTDTTGESAVDDDNTQADTTKYRIRDLRQDPLFSARPYVTGWPNVRAYLEVPLRTSTGLVIGSYCVVDSHLRDDFDDGAVCTMAEIAGLVMDHLDLLKTKQQCERAERLVRGLGVFVEGCSSLRNMPPDGSAHAPPYAVPSSDGLLSVDSPQAPSYSLSSGSSKASGTIPSSADTELSGSAEPVTPMSSLADVDPLELQFDQNEFDEGPQPIQDTTSGRRPPLNPSPPPAPQDAKMTFSRAANLIREGTSIEGIVFLDACPTGFGTLQNTPSRTQRHSSDETTVPLLKDFENGVMCDVLGSSTGPHTPPTNQTFNVPEALLQRLIHSNPRGCLIHADKHGPMPSRVRRANDYLGCNTEDFEAEQQASKDDIEQLLRILPQALSILFLPLWDHHKATWYAATIGWTTDPTRSFEESDMTYMSAFSNSIMIEVARLDALVTSAAKGDFISSISHEFRSPLHGIMASAELLEDVSQDPDQRQLTGMIKSCATTLIDTTNHLLDYAKINRLVKDDRPQLNRASLSSDHSTLSSTVDLAHLVEDVVEGAFIGNASQAKSKSHDGLSVKPPVVVTMDIERRESWALRTEPGAWRRILMNVFGNALKYTSEGLIEVTLKTVETPLSSDSRCTSICLAVKDTGCGMSADYVKRQMFLPYSQENPLSTGVGLGLSIVQHLATELGGRIEVESTPGVGTLVQITIPIDDSAGLLGKSAAPEDSQRESFKAFQGKTVLALDFDTSEDPSSPTKSLLTTFTATSKNWLGVDVLALDEAQGLQLHDAGDMPLIVLSNSAPTAAQKQRALSQNAVFLVQPFGPRKLAWTVARAFACRKTRNAVPALTESVARTEEEKTASGGSTNVNIACSMRKLPATATPLENVSPIGSFMVAKANISDAGPPPYSSTTTTTTMTKSMTTAVTTTRRKPHVLVVDDNSVNIKILTTYMTKLQCTYETAMNGLEAVQAFKVRTASGSKPFDYIFMDISMPVMDGFEATRVIRADERSRRVPKRTLIVALTGLGASSSQKEAFTSGVDIYLMKPVPLKKLKDLLLEKEAL